jgi:hypothetical protein
MTSAAPWAVPHEFTLPKNFQWREISGAPIHPLNLEAPGPVGESYIFGLEPIDYLMGPVGSGKTTCSIFRIPVFAMRMPACQDGVIRCRGAVVHENFRTLYRTGLDSLFQFFPKDFPGAHFEGGQDRPFKFTLRFITPKGKRLQIIIDGFGIGDHAIEQLLRGYEANFFWNIEADLLDRKVPSFQFGRVAQGRYPGRGRLAKHDAPVPASVWGDLNPPLISHWVHEDFVEKCKGGHLLRRQPSGLSDLAENRKYVPRSTYEAMAKTMSPDDVRRFVHGEFGLVGAGALVYPEYDFKIHCATEKLAALDAPLRIGLDAGGTPAAIIGQYNARGHMRWLRELCSEPGQVTGAGRFAEMLIDLLQSDFRGLPVAFGWGDPSAFHGVDRQAGELSFMEIVGRALNLNILPTPTNEPYARQESVAYFLRKRLDTDGTPFFQHCPSMRVTQGGFQGGFLMALNPHDTAGRMRFVKNKFSHPHEAGQYLSYGSRGHAGTINDAARAGRPGLVIPIARGVRVKSDFNV